MASTMLPRTLQPLRIQRGGLSSRLQRSVVRASSTCRGARIVPHAAVFKENGSLVGRSSRLGPGAQQQQQQQASSTASNQLHRQHQQTSPPGTHLRRASAASAEALERLPRRLVELRGAGSDAAAGPKHADPPPAAAAGTGLGLLSSWWAALPSRHKIVLAGALSFVICNMVRPLPDAATDMVGDACNVAPILAPPVLNKYPCAWPHPTPPHPPHHSTQNTGQSQHVCCHHPYGS